MTNYFLGFLFLGLLFFSINPIQGQILSFDHGSVEFYTSSILSDIEATSEEVQATLDTESGEVEVRIAIESFEFEYEMMQEHFNEEYLESDKFQYATFKGKISQDLAKQTEDMEVEVTGELTIHGVTQAINFKAAISKKEDFTVVKCKFPIVFKDFNVEEPSILTKSVAKDVVLKSSLYLK